MRSRARASGRCSSRRFPRAKKTEALSSEGLTAQFDAKETNELFPEKNVEVQGSKSALLSALQKLATTEETQEEKKTVAEDALAAKASNGTNNDLASSYKTPTTSATTTTTDDPTTTYQTTTEGCPVVIDTDGRTAYVQNRVMTLTDGVVTSEGTCSNNGTSYKILESYLSCEAKLDLSSSPMKEWDQFTLYYADDSGETHTVSDCTYNEADYHTITEDEGQCSISIDWETHQAVPQSALVYTNRNGTVVQARGCDTSTLTAAIAMTENVEACTLRHDYTAGLTYERSMWTYIRDGVTYQASSCTDTGQTFPHETVYQDTAGEYVCTPIVNQAAGTVTLQSRKRITIDGVPQYITECTPDTTTQAILSTTDGCMDPSKWNHDLAAGVSYGQERFYYLKGGTTPVYVTSCQTSATTYPQQVEITGYQPHDDLLYAYPLSTVTIDVNGSPYTIASSTVLEGAAQITYTLNGTVDKQNGTRTDEGCDAYFGTTRYEQWERPDTTIYEKAIGDGTPVGPTEACITTTESSTFHRVNLSYSQLWYGYPYLGRHDEWSDPEGSGWSVDETYGSISAVMRYVSRTVRTNSYTGEVFNGTPYYTATNAEGGFDAWTGDSNWYHVSYLYPAATPTGWAANGTPCGGSTVYVYTASPLVLTCGWSNAAAVNWPGLVP